jgi:hypothetical protein
VTRRRGRARFARAGSGGGGGGGGPARRIGGKWPNGETLGLPTGLNLKPMGLADLIGLSPGTSCEFGVCGSIGTGFLGAGLPSSITVDSSLLTFLSAIVQFKLKVGAGTSACAYYDVLCQSGDPYACKAGRCCRDFGEGSQKGNIVRNCLIQEDILFCGGLPADSRQLCRFKTHFECYSGNNFWAWPTEVPGSCYKIILGK